MNNPAVAFHLATARMVARAELAKLDREAKRASGAWDMLAEPEAEAMLRADLMAQRADEPAPLAPEGYATDGTRGGSFLKPY